MYIVVKKRKQFYRQYNVLR